MSGVSLNPAAFVAGGGLLDNADVIIKSARFAPWDYNGTIQTPVLAAKITYINKEDQTETDQFYSAGDMKNFVPSEDGRQAIPVGTVAGLNESTNFYAWLTSLVNAKFPADLIGNDLSVFDGLECHVTRVPQKTRAGLTPAPDAKKQTILIVSQIHKMPGQGGNAAAPAPAKAAKGNAAVASSASVQQAAQGGQSSGIESKTDEVVMGVIMAKGGSVAKSVLAQDVFKAMAKDPDRNAVVQLAYKDEYLGAPGKPWKFDGTTVSLG
jgi:hypothetical protein